MQRVLIFPASTEIGQEYFRSLRYSSEVELHGAGHHSIATLQMPFHRMTSAVGSESLLEEIQTLMWEQQIDLLLPAHDQALLDLKLSSLRWKIPGSPAETVVTCSFKSKTYLALGQNGIQVPKPVESWPCWVKPDRGQGSKGSRGIPSPAEWDSVKDLPLLKLEWLMGQEFTVDCFTDRLRNLRFCQARERLSVKNGISTHCREAAAEVFQEVAEKINQVLTLRGAWFFQGFLNREQFTVTEVAPRISGNSGWSRARGVNLPLLTLHDFWNRDLSFQSHCHVLEQFRILDERFLIQFPFTRLYVDLDDTLISNGKVNSDLVKLIVQCRNQGKVICLLTRHRADPEVTLRVYGLRDLFHQVYWIKGSEPKSAEVCPGSLVVDDSFKEREEIQQNRKNVVTIGPESVPCFFS